MRLLACLAIAIAFMDSAIFAQATTNVPFSALTHTSPEADDKAWSFAASAYRYFVPERPRIRATHRHGGPQLSALLFWRCSIKVGSGGAQLIVPTQHRLSLAA